MVQVLQHSLFLQILIFVLSYMCIICIYTCTSRSTHCVTTSLLHYGDVTVQYHVFFLNKINGYSHFQVLKHPVA